MIGGAHSLTRRLAVYSALASTAILLGAGSLIGLRVQAHFVETDLAEMHGKLELVSHMLGRAGTPAELDAVPAQLADALVGHGHLALAVLAGPRTLFRTPDSPFPDGMLRAPAGPATGATEWDDEGRSFRGIAASVATGVPGQEPVAVAVSIDIGHHREFMAAFRTSLALAMAGGVAFSALLGWAVARGGLLPLHRLAHALRGISAGHLDERLPTTAMPAELVELGQAVNQMLARLQASFARLSHYSSDIAHELRTPVSNLMLQTQVAVSQSRSADEYREALYGNLEEFERLARTIGDMLFLAQADNGLAVPSRAPVDLAAELQALFGFYEALAEEQGVRLELVGAGRIEGDPLMVRRALGNLLANAIRHTPRGRAANTEISPGAGGGVRLRMCNPGAIAPSHLPHLFDRFYRVDDARDASAAGAGLGLAITKSIVAAHGGAIRADSGDGEVCFTIDWPATLPDVPV